MPLSADLLGEQAARAQTLQRHQATFDRLQRHLETLYEDRLDGRIDADMYDQKAADVRADQQRIQTKMSECQGALPPATEAVDLMALTSKCADLFGNQPAGEQSHDKDFRANSPDFEIWRRERDSVR